MKPIFCWIILFALPFHLYSQVHYPPDNITNMDDRTFDNISSKQFNIKGNHDEANRLNITTENNFRVDSAIYNGATGWMDSFKELFYYNDDGFLIDFTKMIYVSFNAAYKKYERIVYNYDEDGNIIKKIYLDCPEYSNEWENWHQISYTYDENNKLSTELYQDWANDSWQNFLMLTYTNNEANALQSILEQHWINNSWQNMSKLNYVYDSISQIIEETLQEWYWSANSWQDVAAHFWTYDINGNVLNYLWQWVEYDTLVNHVSFIYTYDANDNNLTFIRQEWEENAWVNDSKRTYTYDNNHNKLTELNQNWSTVNDWENFELHTLTYTSEDKIHAYLLQYWQSETWQNQDFNTYAYNDLNEVENIIRQYWDVDNNTWANETKTMYLYNGGHVNTTAYLWNGSDWELGMFEDLFEIRIDNVLIYSVVSRELNLYYAVTTGIEDLQSISTDKALLCYPNPVSDLINIPTAQFWSSDNIRVCFYNLTGQKLKDFIIQTSLKNECIKLDVRNMPSGHYIIKVSKGSQCLSQKLIIK